ncbi:MAG: bifunctional (p)ppGpp synthetase/guanosine-3',5'-bis(diphosphate) 3'-pyrophosphohydrolase [Sphingomonadales bacterium]|nr:bifunctional (p)ppGpp synthetase/guanosine-3',5'-bis(diphosphate) 3'-pyrophosphohydrolase [Sphingomonadales bacterium]
MIRQYELVERVKSYDPKANEDMLNRAYVFSMKAHGSQTRASGDPYFSHPLEVAGILTDMKLDSDTVVTGLLHDTVEDTLATIDEIDELFGNKIAQLVDGVTKLSKIKMQTESERQAENFRKFLLATSDDIRVLLVKLADRLHNMRTLHFVEDPDKRQRVALETMEIYAPLAERIGMREIKDELEHLSFGILNPEALETVDARLDYLRKQGKSVGRTVIRQLTRTLKKAGIKANVSGREKRPYSIWSKMERNHIAFEQMADVMAFRIIVDDVETCYRAIGIVHGSWPMVPGRFKDYISTPKPNNYQSIHTTVIGPEKLRIEIQIRTQEMHDIAELGVAAHWIYKRQSQKTDDAQYRWLRELVEILEHAHTPEEFLEHTKLAMFQDQVFCFTPKGDLISLPRGATPVDFAYAVHSDVGNTTVGAKVNGRMVPLRYQLHNGDQVEILRSTAQTPSPRWESFVVTAKARAAVRRFVRQQEVSEYANLGQSILETAFDTEGVEFSQKSLKSVLPRFGVKRLQDLYAQVGQGLIGDTDVLRAAYPGIQLKGDRKHIPPAVHEWQADDEKKGHSVPIRGLTPGVAVHLSDCCHPLPGDRIVGVVASGRGVDIHTIDCETLEDVEDSDQKWLDVAWQRRHEEAEFYTGRIRLVVLNEAGALASITAIVAKHNGNISNIRFLEREPEFFTMWIDIEVQNVRHLSNIMTALRALRVISSAERLRG